MNVMQPLEMLCPTFNSYLLRFYVFIGEMADTLKTRTKLETDFINYSKVVSNPPVASQKRYPRLGYHLKQ